MVDLVLVALLDHLGHCYVDGNCCDCDGQSIGADKADQIETGQFGTGESESLGFFLVSALT